ncbi:MAG: AAA family ATPase [Anaerolineae bacterium]|nr:AAA family ATPase [Anaerolineae bacterium]
MPGGNANANSGRRKRPLTNQTRPSTAVTTRGQRMNTAVNQQIFGQLSNDDQARLLALLAQERAAGANGHGPQSPLVTVDANLGLQIRPLTDLLAQNFPPLHFLVDGLLAKGHLAMLGGRPKSGKSWLTLQLAQAIDQGRAFLGRETRRGRVLLIALEDGRRRVYQRCQILKWQPRDTAVCFDIAHFNGDGKTVDIGPGLKQLEAAAADYDLVIIDTLIATLNGRANENDNASMGAVVNELARIAHDTETAILLVHHTGKGSAENIFDLLRGASALRGGYDVGMVLARKQEEREAILHVESRDFDAESLTIRQADGGAGWECLGNGRVLEEVRAGREIVAAIIRYGEGLTVKELADGSGKSEQTIRDQLKRAFARGLVRQEKEERENSLKPVAVWYLTEAGGVNI